MSVVSKKKFTKGYTIANLKYLFDQKKLWLNPTYQREAVWTKSQKQLLMDSLFREIDIPKFYFRECNVGSYEYEVVDGQQRLRSIFEYIENEYKLPRDADPVAGHKLASSEFKDLHTDLQMLFQNVQLDVVEMNSAYTDDDIEEIFLRLQNGTPLNAPEKRRAIKGTMRDVVADLAEHKVFEHAAFQDRRYAYEDAIAKVMHLMLASGITDIRPASIAKTYKNNSSISTSDKVPGRLKGSLNFMAKAFKGKQSPQLKKFSVITLSYLTAEMLEEFDLSQHAAEYADCYLDFEARRVKNEELPEDQQDSALAAYTDAARSDSIQDMQYRHDYLKREFVAGIPDLTLKDPTRDFTNEQRMAIYRLTGGQCVMCPPGTVVDDTDFHADHVVPHSKGGKTQVANGQVLCATHNLQKGNKSQP